ncbi:MAG: EVE domain-containing protein [Solirubrobacteraceae bacterium]
MRYWLAIVSRDHVKRGVDLGIAQIGHGKRAGVARMHAGDWLIYYSARASLTSKEPLQAFTAIGQISEGPVWQADEGDFKPWRRSVTYVEGAADAPIGPLRQKLELTSLPNWGYQLRRGLVELTERDFRTIRTAMGVRE